MNNKIGVTISAYAYYTLEEALIGISQYGFKYLELRAPISDNNKILDLQNINNTLAMCRKYGVKLICLAGHERLMREDSVENFKKVIDSAALLGIKYIDTNTGEIKNKNDEDTFYKEIKIIVDYAASKGITIGLEIHDDWCKNGKIASEIIKKINHPNIKITYDTGNTIFYGDTKPEEDIKYALPFIGNIHLKDKKGGYKVWDFPALGEGDIDFSKIFDLLKYYHGPMHVEIEFDGKKHSLAKVNSAVKNSYKFLESYNLI